MSFRVGQRVVCVNADLDASNGLVAGIPATWSDNLDGLREREVYTVRFVGMQYGHPMVWLREIKRGPSLDGSEAGFAALRFRPVAYPKQSAEHDISLFNGILDKAMERA